MPAGGNMRQGSRPVNSGRIWRRLLSIVFVCGMTLSTFAEESVKIEAVSTAKPNHPMVTERFMVEGHSAFLMLPVRRSGTDKTPWVWYAPTLPDLPGKEEQWMFRQFLDAGMAIAGIDVGESYGNPQGCAVYTSLYVDLVRHRGLSERACLLARSRGGLMLYNWATDHPSSVACIAGIYPACDLASYPGLKVASVAYGMTEEQLSAVLGKYNPIDRLGPLAKAGVAIFHLHGDRDTVVPLEKNSGELSRRYRQLGGTMVLRIIEGQGHNRWSGWFESQELVDFVIAHARNPSGSGSSGP
jgi:hypothetical protein